MNTENKSLSTGTQKKAASNYAKWGIGIAAIGIYVVVMANQAASNPGTAPTPQVQEIQVTDVQCKEALNELYAVDKGGTASPKDPQYGLIQNLIRQYASEVGLTTGDSSVHYDLPVTSCGKTLAGLINVNIQGAVNSR